MTQVGNDTLDKFIEPVRQFLQTDLDGILNNLPDLNLGESETEATERVRVSASEPSGRAVASVPNAAEEVVAAKASRTTAK
jgi:hypothetical protein